MNFSRIRYYEDEIVREQNRRKELNTYVSKLKRQIKEYRRAGDENNIIIINGELLKTKRQISNINQNIKDMKKIILRIKQQQSRR